MNRLTQKRSLDGYDDVGLRDGVTEGDAICRLADYEGTGLEPEEIMALIDPPNPPLTPEELQEMVGGPAVWVVAIGEDEENYALITGVDDENVYMLSTLRPNDYGSIELYGDTWLAYRRKPEEDKNETTDNR